MQKNKGGQDRRGGGSTGGERWGRGRKGRAEGEKRKRGTSGGKGDGECMGDGRMGGWEEEGRGERGKERKGQGG